MAALSTYREVRPSALLHQPRPEPSPAMQRPAMPSGQVPDEVERQVELCVRGLVNAVTAAKMAAEARRRWMRINGSGCTEAARMQALLAAENGRVSDMAHRIIDLLDSAHLAVPAVAAE
ncbi:hypothetical protein [Azospirillum picis]|uniref:ANTAR domain-containing protein n=1 Tax=Azospirillum picis TaxID=488438 RepID=A0ABU0MN25_9PROT|nr:hypothetical protein [Azospirillum picis]MBP2301236.1 hypothetical protein [Azospirillum picis]MDQ0534801.1 hypothetical protein [Azospirillum picis]